MSAVVGGKAGGGAEAEGQLTQSAELTALAPFFFLPTKIYLESYISSKNAMLNPTFSRTD